MPDGGSLLIQSKQTDHRVDFVLGDSGAGMTKEVLDKIFTPLFTTKAKGMGFGLSICKRIVEAHGGSISAESTRGEGTTFTVSIPADLDTTGDVTP
jgi:two-component system sensor histidine kinase HydH